MDAPHLKDPFWFSILPTAFVSIEAYVLYGGEQHFGRKISC
jgi:hypothetical protein